MNNYSYLLFALSPELYALSPEPYLMRCNYIYFNDF